MIVRNPRNVRLTDIAGVSPLNPRQQVDDDGLDGLAASIIANGVIEDILVETRDKAILVLDGSRRWRAFQRLVETDRIAADAEIGVVEIIGSEVDKREIATAVNFHRLDLHPVEEFEAFAGMAQAGRSEAEIAAHFHIEPRDVKKSLALGRLAPEIRAAWKSGEIDAAAAQAFTVAREHGRQREIFAALSPIERNAPATIRRLLRGDAVIATASIAIFARADYIAAGGRIEESLFEDQAFFEDGPLLRKIAEDKLRTIAERIRAAEGWSWALTQFDDEAGTLNAFVVKGEADYTRADLKRREEIEAIDLAGVDQDKRLELQAEAEQIELRAWRRGVSKTQRACLGFVLSIDQDGAVEFEGALERRGAAPSAQEVADAAADAIRDRVAEARERVAAPSTPPAAPPSHKLRALTDAAIAGAIGACVTRNINLALAVSVASLACHGPSISRLRGVTVRMGERDLVDSLAGLSFEEAFEQAVAAPLADLTTAFAELVSCSIEAAGWPAAGMERIVAAISGVSDIAGALDKAFDRRAWFKASSRKAALAAISEIQGMPCGDLAGGRSALADYAADCATSAGWLPQPLSAWIAALPVFARETDGLSGEKGLTLAGAMQVALEADLDGQAVARFLETRTRKGDGLRIRATELHEAFVGFCVAEGIEGVPGLGAFGTIVKRLGVARYCHKTGIFYTGVALTKAPDEPQQMAAE